MGGAASVSRATSKTRAVLALRTRSEHQPAQPTKNKLRSLEAAPRHGVKVIRSYALPSGAILCYSIGNVERFTGDAIVNAASEGCLGGAGVDGAITKAGGPKLAAARQRLKEVSRGVRCPTGSAVVTVGGALKAKWCIHAVGPRYGSRPKDEDDALLRSAYAAALDLAAERKAASVAFPLLSGGVFKGQQSSLEVALKGVQQVASSACAGLEVHLVAFGADLEGQKAIGQACEAVAGAKRPASPQNRHQRATGRPEEYAPRS